MFNKRTKRIFENLLIAFAVMGVCLGYFYSKQDRIKLSEKGTKTEGVIVNAHLKRGTLIGKVKFHVGGAEIMGWESLPNTGIYHYQIGDTVAILYARDKPEMFMVLGLSNYVE